MIQDIHPKKYNNSYRNITPEENDTVVFAGSSYIFAKEDEKGNIVFPLLAEVRNICSEFIYLFEIDNDRFFLGTDEKCFAELEKKGYGKIEISFFRHMQPRWKFFAGITAFQLAGWYRKNTFCGQCGKKMIHSKDERMLRCGHCGNTVYPKICPAVIVAVTDGDRLLVTRYNGAKKDSYALIAGFAEIGETIEETVKREVAEETGIKVKNLRYYKSQPWSFSDTLLFGFFCELDGSPEITVDHSELAAAEWRNREDLVKRPDNISLTSEMINRFIASDF